MHILSPKPTRLHNDFETFSEVNLRSTGVSIYSRHPSTEVLMCGYALDDQDVKQWVPEEGEAMPAELEDAVLDPSIKKYAWNAQFERYIWKFNLGIDIPLDQWRDPMVMAYSVSLPGQLLKCGEVLGLPEEYLKKDGHRFINWFSKLRPATKTMPERRVRWFQKMDLWRDYKEYNVWDVKSERKIYRLLRKYDLPEHEWELWALDQEINERGIPVNMEMCRNIIEVRDELVGARIKRMKEISGLDNPNANGQLLRWLQDHGYIFDDLKAGHIRRAKDRLDAEVKDGGIAWEEVKDLYEMLDLRSEVSKSSTKKFDAVSTHTDEDGRLRNCFQFCAAGRTWRWGGRVFQPQNLAKPVQGLDGLEWTKLESGFEIVSGGTQVTAANILTRCNAEAVEMLFDRPIDAMSGAVRTVVQAPEGYVFVDADLAAIENVVLGYLSGDRKILGVFESGRDPYVDFATYLYNQPYEVLWDEYKVQGNKKKRTVAKPGVLGCGYMLGAGHQYENRETGEIEATGLLGYAWNMGVKLTPQEAEHSVKVWRNTFKDAVAFWYDLQNAAFKTMRTKKPTACGPVEFDVKGSFLRMRLPSGRYLHYYKPRVEDVLAPWGDMKPTLTYMGLNEKNQFVRISTHPGKVTENADQAIARDLLAHGMMNANREGIPIVMHIHDQIVGLVKEDRAEDDLKLLIQCMTDLPSWGKGMPVRAAGHLSNWFVKD